MAVQMSLSVIALIGIILVDFAIHAERTQGESPELAIYRACMMLFRPILMTTMATLFGGIPLMVGTGTGSELGQPLGYTIVGGLFLSQLLTLYTMPIVYLYLAKLRSHAQSGAAPSATVVETGATPAE